MARAPPSSSTTSKYHIAEEKRFEDEITIQDTNPPNSLTWSDHSPRARPIQQRASQRYGFIRFKSTPSTEMNPEAPTSQVGSNSTSSTISPPQINKAATPPPSPSTSEQCLQVIGSFFPYMNSWGLLNSFGGFQEFYSSQLLAQKSASEIAWIGSMQAFLLLFVGVLVGPAIDMGYMRHVILLGTFLMFFGLMMTSLGHEYYQLMLAQGLVTGVGVGCVFLPSITVVPQWVSPNHRTAVMGIVATGSSLGGVIYPIMFHYIQRSAGFGWAVRAIAFVTLPTNIFAALVLKTRTLPPTRRSLLEPSMFKEQTYPFLCAAFFFAFIGLYIPIFFLQSFSTQLTQPPISATLSFYLLPILMAASAPGRVLPNLLADKIGTLNVYLPVTLLCSILSLIWIALNSTSTIGGLVAFAIFYGFSSGAFVSLVPMVVVSTAPSMAKLGTRMGMALSISSFGIILGNPVAGAILSSTGKYTGSQVFAGMVLMVSALLVLVVRVLKVGPKIMVKV